MTKKMRNIDVPQHLKNYKDSNYLYPHNYPNAFVNQQYVPQGINQTFYSPVGNGFESKIKNKPNKPVSVLNLINKELPSLILNSKS